MKKTYLELMKENATNPSDALAQEIDARQTKHMADMEANEPAIETIKKVKLKVLVSGDADIAKSGNSFSVLSHVLLFNEDDSTLHSVRYTGNNGTIFNSQDAAEEAISIYKKGDFNRRFDNAQIIEL